MLTAESLSAIRDPCLRRISIGETARPMGHGRETIRLIVHGTPCLPPALCHVRLNSLGVSCPTLRSASRR